ncbi:MAG: caspase family protein [Planctomycetia bacterium]|nr:caspase family protein [Planctomycetia bacterium]
MSKFAFLTGINQYSLLPQLKFARQDAEAVAGVLRENYQFLESEITLLSDAQAGCFMPTTTDVIRARLQELEGTKPQLFLFGFWGHGFFRDQLYFCPMGVSKEKVTTDGLSMAEVVERIGRIGASNVVLVLDCCQNEAARSGLRDEMPAKLSASHEANLASSARSWRPGKNSAKGYSGRSEMLFFACWSGSPSLIPMWCLRTMTLAM